MTKAEIVAAIAEKTGIERVTVLATVETFMDMTKGENIYLRGFGSFIIKTRAQKAGRNISKNQSLVIPEHKIPAFKPAKPFKDEVKNNLKVK